MKMLCLFLFFATALAHSGLPRESGYLEVNGVRHYYESVGQGPPLLLLHGGPGMFHDYFLPHVENLGQDFRVIMYDQRGNGNSVAEVNAENFTIDQLVEDLEGVRAALGLERVQLLGHSWGGLLAMYYGIKYPNRLDKLILLSSAPADAQLNLELFQNKTARHTPESVARIEALVQSPGLMNGDVAVFTELVKLVERVNVHDPNRMEHILSGLTYTPERIQNAMKISGLKEPFFADYNLYDQLKVIQCPTLIIRGAADTIPEKSDLNIQASIAGSRLVIMDKSGHYAFAEQPTRFALEVTSFLKEESAQTGRPKKREATAPAQPREEESDKTREDQQENGQENGGQENGTPTPHGGQSYRHQRARFHQAKNIQGISLHIAEKTIYRVGFLSDITRQGMSWDSRHPGYSATVEFKGKPRTSSGLLL